MESFDIYQLKPYIEDTGSLYVNVKTGQYNGKLLVDTGFSEGLVLPNKLKPKFDDNFALPTQFVLGNGEVTQLEVYIIDIVWQGQYLGVCGVIFTSDKTGLIGIEFLRLLQKKIVINWKEEKFLFS